MEDKDLICPKCGAVHKGSNTDIIIDGIPEATLLGECYICAKCDYIWKEPEDSGQEED